MMRFSFVLLAPCFVLACGQSFSASAPDAGVDASSGVEGGVPDGSAGDAPGESCGAVPSCPQLGWACGTGQDSCGRAVDCGDCTKANELCDASHQCKCTPLTCADFKAECGNVPDGCGNTLSCGTCEAGATCGGGGTLQCGSGTCMPATCTSMNAQCGSIEDGCGNIVPCPDTCVAPQTCDGSGNATQCGCTPQTCTDLGWQCGSGDNGCGGTIDCGACDGGTCDPNAHSCTCVPTATCGTLGYTCGAFTDSCNAVEPCGPTPTPGNVLDVCTNPTYPHFYTCCGGGAIPGTAGSGGAGGAGGSSEGGAPDGGACSLGGATPPEPGWNCVAAGSKVPAQGWCCSQ